MADAHPASGRAVESECGKCEDASEAAAEAELAMEPTRSPTASFGYTSKRIRSWLQSSLQTSRKLSTRLLHAFTACACETNCMKRLAATDGGAIFDALLARVREAAEREKATVTEAAAEAGTGSAE